MLSITWNFARFENCLNWLMLADYLYFCQTLWKLWTDHFSILRMCQNCQTFGSRFAKDESPARGWKVCILKYKMSNLTEQEHKVSYRCSLPSPLQKRSKDFKGLQGLDRCQNSAGQQRTFLGMVLHMNPFSLEISSGSLLPGALGESLLLRFEI